MKIEVAGSFLDRSSRRGLLWRFHEAPIAVSFLSVDGAAVFEGDIILGPADLLEQRYRANEEEVAEDEAIGWAEAKVVRPSAHLAIGMADPRWPGAMVPA